MTAPTLVASRLKLLDHHREEEVFLVTKVVIEGGLVHHGGVGDLLHRDRRVALRGEEQPGLAQDATAPADIRGRGIGFDDDHATSGKTSPTRLTTTSCRSIVGFLSANQPVG